MAPFLSVENLVRFPCLPTIVTLIQSDPSTAILPLDALTKRPVYPLILYRIYAIMDPGLYKNSV